MLNPFKRQFKICRDEIFTFKGDKSKVSYTVWERSLRTFYMWESCDGNYIFVTLEEAKAKIDRSKEPTSVEVWRE
jgi:hypothetical protein